MYVLCTFMCCSPWIILKADLSLEQFYEDLISELRPDRPQLNALTV